MEERDPAEFRFRPPGALIKWSPWALLGLALLVGAWARMAAYGQTVVADELSTLWIVKTHGLGGTVDFVYGDGEISPPLYFILAWFASKLGSAPELIRLPSMLFAAASMPLYYVLGKRLFGRWTGILATVIAALSPMLIYTAATGRAYSVAFFFLLLSTVALLFAAESGRTRWWVIYAFATAAAMYCHYTVAFVLAGQLIWLLIYHPAARKGAILANLGAVLLYLPWVPGYLADSDSPTTPILEALQGYGFEAKRLAVEQVLFWEVTAEPWTLASRWDVLLLAAGVLLAAVAATVALARRESIVAWVRRLDPAITLTVILIFATPVGAFLLGRFSTDVFGTRNIAAMWIGLPVAIGALLYAAGRYWGTVATLLVVAGLTIGAVKIADGSRSEIGYDEAAEYVEARFGPGDSVVSTSQFTPVPYTPLDAYLDPDVPRYQLGLPTSEPPFLPGSTEIPEAGVEWKRALADSDRIFVVAVDGAEELAKDHKLIVYTLPYDLPDDWEVVSQHTIPGVRPVTVSLLERRDAPGKPAKGDD